MSDAVMEYINNRAEAWQTELCQSLHQMVHGAIPDVTERLQYGKPHYLKHGKYICVLSAAKGAVTFTIFNAAALDAPDGLFAPGPPERRTLKVTQGQAVDYPLLAQLLQEAVATIP